MKLKAILLLVAIVLILPCTAFADKYFRGDCNSTGTGYAGDGTSWACAESAGGTGAYLITTNLGNMTLLPASYTWPRGNTFWFVGSDKNYGPLGFRNSSGTATNYITIKRATDADCSAQTGWATVTAGEKAKQASFTSASIREASYVEINGVTGDGKATTGYGFKFRNVVASAGYTHNYIVLKHLEITQRGETETWSCYDTAIASGTYEGSTVTNPITFTGQSWDNNTLGRYELINNTSGGVGGIDTNTADTITLEGTLTGGSRTTMVSGDSWEIALWICSEGVSLSGDGHIVQNNYIHHVGICARMHATNFLFSGNYCRYNQFNGEHHNPVFVHTGSTNAIIENSIFEDGTGTTCIGTPSTGGYALTTNTIIRNNIFRESDDNPEGYSEGGFAGEGIIGSWSGQHTIGVKIYNNTFYNFIRSSAMIDYDEADEATGIEIKNNLWYCDKGASCKSAAYRTKVGVELTTSTNAFYGNSKNANETNPVTLAATDPFTNSASGSAGGDFSLKSCSGSDCAINTGTDLSASWASALDYIGTSRPQGAAWDIGAYEYNPTTAPKNSISGGTLGGGGAMR